jgi:hypothetical protein
MRDTSIAMQAWDVRRREAQADQREVQADRRQKRADEREAQADLREERADEREAQADLREERADEREEEFSRLHPPTPETAVEIRRDILDRALAQLQRAEDAVARARTHLARAEHHNRVLDEEPARERKDGEEPTGD